jgi:hypothetical protein
MVRNGHIMYRSANGTKWLWYEMAMVRNGYGTKIIFTMVRNGRYEMVMVRNECNSLVKLRTVFVSATNLNNTAPSIGTFAGRGLERS